MTFVREEENGKNGHRASGVWSDGRCPSSLDTPAGALARFGLIDRGVECRLQVIMLQPETLLRRRILCAADPYPSSPRRSSKKNRCSGFFKMKSLIDRRGKEKGRLISAYPRDLRQRSGFAVS
jgi:hypothetical protein